MSEITLIGFNNYMNANNTPLFDKILLPEGIDKEVLIDTIILKAGEFEPIYMNPLFLQDAIGVWSKKWFNTFDKWYKALQISYDPLNNYDRYEEYEDVRTENSKAKDKNTSISEGETDNGKSAYNAGADYQKHDNSKMKSNGTNESDTTMDVLENNKHKAHLYGNIGVTTSQQMLLSELDEAAVWNLYEHIADVFIKEFCIMIY